jgi:phosphopantetheine--protein transferase-like protein
MSFKTASDRDIAVIGMSALFAGAKDLSSYWQNILKKVNAVADAPDAWASPYFDTSSAENDRIYTRKGGFLGQLAEFDPLEFGIMPNAVDGGEPDQYLALKLAQDALRDSGYDERPFDREKAGIILGRGTYVNRGYTNLMQHGMVVDQTLNMLRHLCPDLGEEMIRKIRKGLKDSLPPFTAEMVPGLVPNIVTGRIANRLNLMGPNFIIDAACASSLIAIELSIRELLSGRCDMVLTGGVHASTPPQIYMIFCLLDALSHTIIRPFDKAADGTQLGEGLGILVLKRLRDAEADCDRIYAVIKGVGTSSDGKALGLLAPRLEGEILALKRAYQGADIDPATIGLIEAHGTGIPLGDQTEIQALSSLFGKRKGMIPGCALGTVKSMIGHCIPASGAAGVIKTILALYHKILPPTLCSEINPKLEIEHEPFYINNEARPWIHGNPEMPRRAGVNSFGFGGINAHIILEEYKGAPEESFRILHSEWPTELIVFSANTLDDLLDSIEKTRRYIQTRPDTPLADIAFTLSAYKEGGCRLAIVAKNTGDLVNKLKIVSEKLHDGGIHKLQTRTGIYFSGKTQTGKVAFLFPGEGSQYPGMLSELCMHFPKVREWFDFLEETFYDEREIRPGSVIFPAPTSLTSEAKNLLDAQLFEMDIGSEAVFTADMALNDLLCEFNIRCDAMLGHSTGENAALVASGTLRIHSRSELREKMHLLNRIYRELSGSDSIPRGSFLAVGSLQPDMLNTFLAEHKGKIYLAMDNCPNQVLLFGSNLDMEEAGIRLRELGCICAEMPFDRAYHTPLFEPVGKAFRKFYDSLDMGPGHVPLFSCATADLFPALPDEIRSLASRQWYSHVRFRETVEKLYADGFRVFVEVGPDSNLTSFVHDILRGKECLALASISRRVANLEQLQNVIARLFVFGMQVNMAPLYACRNLHEVSPVLQDTDAALCGDGQQDKMKSVLNLDMPVMRLDPELIGEVQSELNSSLYGTHERLASGPYDSEQDSSFRERQELISRHFDLMQKLLDSQEHFMSGLLSDQEAGQVEKNKGILTDAPGRDAHSRFAEEWPLLGEIIEQDHARLVCERRFDLERDTFLSDHTLGGAPSERNPRLLALPVIPFTFSMEMIAEAAQYLAGRDKKVISMQNLRGYRWLTLDDGTLTVRIHARIQESGGNGGYQSVRVQVFGSSAGKDQALLVFEGEVRLADQYPQPPSQLQCELENASQSRQQDTDLYNTGMFHGPRLQGVKHICRWSNQGIEADLLAIPTDNFFSSVAKPVFRTDPGLIDAAGQMIAYWLTEKYGSDFNCFPFLIGSFNQYSEPVPPGSRVRCCSSIRFTSEREIEADFLLRDESGRVLASLKKWTDRYFVIPHSFYRTRLHPSSEYLSEEWMGAETGLICRRINPFPDNFFDDSWAIWKRVLAHVMLNKSERIHWYNLPETGPVRTNWLLGRIAAKDVIRQWASQNLNLQLGPADIEIKATELGKPFAWCPVIGEVIPDISISHSQGHIVAAAARQGMQIGIDIERLDKVHSDDLLIGGAFSPEEIPVLETLPHQERSEWLKGFWCAKEAAAKCLGTGLQGNPGQWQVIRFSTSDRKVILSYNGQLFESQLWYAPAEVLAVCQYKK